jgi:hypothetical protein
MNSVLGHVATVGARNGVCFEALTRSRLLNFGQFNVHAERFDVVCVAHVCLATPLHRTRLCILLTS